MPKRVALANIPPADLKRLRLMSGLTTEQAADLVYKGIRSWQLWESGDRPMPMSDLELFLCKTGLTYPFRGRPPKK